MNPVFVFLVIVGAALLWILLSGLFRLIGSLTQHTINKTKDALNDDSRGKIESFADGFKSSFSETICCGNKDCSKYWGCINDVDLSTKRCAMRIKSKLKENKL